VTDGGLETAAGGLLDPHSGRADVATRRLLVVADADSYVKWGAALASTLPPPWTARVVVIASPVQPSRRQLADALAGTRFAPADALVVHLDELDGIVDRFDPHAVLLSLRGPFVRVVAPRLERRPNRPALLSGFPGLTIPAVPKAVIYREQTDLIVLHSRREVREFRANAAELGIDRAFGLATLPFLGGGGRGADGSAPTAPSQPTDAAASAGTDVVFAAQAKVPAERADRIRVLAALASYARAHRDRRVIVKVRARRGEAQTHAEEFDYADLLVELSASRALDVPRNLVVEDGPMAAKLANAGALVTVGSTAALEAIALDLPVLLLDDFGIAPAMINTVFEGSGLFGSTTDLVAGRFQRADAAWLHDNYFHGAGADDWVRRLESYVAAREIVPLPRLERTRNLSGGALRAAFERRRMLGAHDRSLSGALAWGVGVPVRAVVRRMRALRLVGSASSVDGGGVARDVREVGLGVAADARLLVGAELASHLGGDAGDEGSGRHDGALQHDGAGRNE
jgi:hypothetical protein